jgi:hypothetical protein
MSLAKIIADGPVLWASPKSPVYDLGEAMDAVYGAGNWSLASDARPAATLALQALRGRYGRGILRLTGAQAFRFNGGLAAADCNGNFIDGYSQMGSQIQLNFGAGPFFPMNGAAGFTGGGIRNVNFSLLEGFGNTTVTLVKLDGDAVFQASECEFSNIYASARGDSYYYRGGHFDGTARTSPPGIRVLNIRNWHQFRCHNMAFLFWNVVQASIDNIGSYVGTGAGMDVVIGGGGAANTNTTQLGMRDLVCGGDLNLTNARNVYLTGKAATCSRAPSFDHYAVDLDCPTLTGTPGPNGRWNSL